MAYKIVISPAKSLDEKSTFPFVALTQPQFEDEILTLSQVLKKQSAKQLSDLMDISDKLAHLNLERNQNFSWPFTAENARPALYTFNGDVYEGINASSLQQKEVDFLQEHLLILSGLYGLLRPLDLMQPYRLEMGTSLKVGRKKDLYAFWGDKLSEYLNQELGEDDWLLNLASQEYFKALPTRKLKPQVISPVFKDFKNGKLKIISFFAKKARGLMVRYVAQNQIKSPGDLLAFNQEGYRFSAEETRNESEPVFVR